MADYEQLNATFHASPASHVLHDTFERDLARFYHHDINRIVCLGVTRDDALKQLVFIKSLQAILKHQHNIKDMYFQIDNTTTAAEKSFLNSLHFTLLPANGNKEDFIYTKITTRTLIFAPSISSDGLYTALRYSGFAVLICPDIDDTIATMRAQGDIYTSTDKVLGFCRIQVAGFKRKMTGMATGLGEIGGTWCQGMSVHWIPAGEGEKRATPLQVGRAMPER